MPGLGVIGSLLVKFGLNRLEQGSIEDSGLLAWENLTLVSDLPDIEAIAQQSGERSTSERDASDCSSIG